MKRADMSDGLKACSRCRVRKEPSQFYRDKQAASGLLSSCKECWRDFMDARRSERPDYYRESAKQTMRGCRARARAMVLQGYGGKCACCGEKEPVFLALDHVNNDGHAHRSALGGKRPAPNHVIYRDAIRRGFPPDLQLLCHNCNMAKAILGACPHVKAAAA